MQILNGDELTSNYTIVNTHYLGELNSSGHVTITHHILASAIRVFCVIILPRSDKMEENFGSSLLPYLVTFLFSFI